MIVYDLSTYEANQLTRIRPLFAWRSGAREEFEVKDARKRTASGGDRFAIVLEFEFLSRIIASMQSMNWYRHRRGQFRMSLSQEDRNERVVHFYTREIREAS
jgi:hypothetical protein